MGRKRARKNEGELRRGAAGEPVRLSLTTLFWYSSSCYTRRGSLKKVLETLPPLLALVLPRFFLACFRSSPTTESLEQARWNANRCYSLRATYLIFEAFQILFPTASLIFYSCEVVSSSDMRTNEAKLRPLCIYNGGCFEDWKLLHVSSCKMFTFCDVLHETK